MQNAALKLETRFYSTFSFTGTTHSEITFIRNILFNFINLKISIACRRTMSIFRFRITKFWTLVLNSSCSLQRWRIKTQWNSDNSKWDLIIWRPIHCHFIANNKKLWERQVFNSKISNYQMKKWRESEIFFALLIKWTLTEHAKPISKLNEILLWFFSLSFETNRQKCIAKRLIQIDS